MSTVALVRHASAGDRRAWEVDDRLRPLDPEGLRQAAGLVGLLEDLPVARILSSPSRRCVQTVEPLARARGLEVIEDEDLWEENPEASIQVVLALADMDAVICTHGDNIPAVLDHLHTYQDLDVGPRPASKKGSTWVLETRDGLFVSARYLRPPV